MGACSRILFPRKENIWGKEVQSLAGELWRHFHILFASPEMYIFLHVTQSLFQSIEKKTLNRITISFLIQNPESSKYRCLTVKAMVSSNNEDRWLARCRIRKERNLQEWCEQLLLTLLFTLIPVEGVHGYLWMRSLRV